jgi:sugar phosphate isomerase/epimerase
MKQENTKSASPFQSLTGRTVMLKRNSQVLLALVTALACLIAFSFAFVWAEGPQAGWKAGVATVVITPEEPIWMAGYAARNKPSEGKVHDLHAKALAMEDGSGTRLVVVAVDILGIPRGLRERLEKEATERYALPPESLLLNASHTHCGPEVNELMAFVWCVPPERIKQSREYVKVLERKLLGLIGEAIDKLAPARLAYTHARAGFAMNRRLKTERGVALASNADGAVDHDVPVLCVEGPDGQLRAVLFGYACHCTTLSFYQICGDYAGFAQLYLEEAHPGTTALFMAGCGADQNPYPRGTLALAEQHGRALANGVEAALLSPAKPVGGPLRAALDDVVLEFADPPTREQLEQRLKSDNQYERRHAEVMLKELEETGKIHKTYPYPVHVAQFGNDLTMVALAGEVVVGYSLRLKAELTGAPVWVAGYSNDVFGYVPTETILQEGGYEAVVSAMYYGLPAPFARSVEKLIVDKVHELVGKVRAPANNALACRVSCYGKYQDSAWTHLPSIGVKHVFLNVPAPEQVEAMKRRLAENGLTAAVLRGDADLSQPSGLDTLASQLKTCEEMSVKYMFLSPKRNGTDKEVIYQRLRQAGDIAKKHGVTIALETHPDLGTNGDIHLETMKRINHPNIRVNFDTANIHFYNHDRDAPTELKKIIDYVATVEIKDHDGKYMSWNFPALGQGVVNIPEVLRILQEHGYAGPLTMEIEGIRGVEWDEAQTKKNIADSAAYVRSLGEFK